MTQKCNYCGSEEIQTRSMGMKCNLKKANIFRSRNWILILLLLPLTACQSTLSVTPTKTISLEATKGDVLVTVTRQPTVTPILLPSPIPTLSLTEKKAATEVLYLTNANCELPCWWGIVPGETDWQTAKHSLSTIATMITTGTQSEFDPVFVVEVDIPVPEYLDETGNLRHQFVVRDGIIVKIRLDGPWGTTKIDTVSEILHNYGSPTEIWLETWGYTFGNNYYPFSVALFYPELGILVRYSDEDAKLVDGYVTGCPQNDSGTLWLWVPEHELTFIESLGKQQGQHYKPLEEVSEMDVEIFYQTYLDPDTETCIETPAELWMDR